MKKCFVRLLWLSLLCAAAPAFADVNVDEVLRQLDLQGKEVEKSLLVQKPLPDSEGLSVVVVPVIHPQEEPEVEIYDAYILLAKEDGRITHKFYQAEAWVSDAIALARISIDTAPYLLNAQTRAFGVRVHSEHISQAIPFEGETISLFVPRRNTLQKVLNDYEIYSGHGEFGFNGGSCEGYHTETKGGLVLSNQQTNGYNDIIVRKTITDRVVTLRGEACHEKEIKSKTSQRLRFVKGAYR
ncbi:MAG: hypothetical protein LBS89_02245 [Zoogloeaceae bacterium]|jgi:hypothetical protein|nr:hypothetical protein [Zoogloeaceae bacterium]